LRQKMSISTTQARRSGNLKSMSSEGKGGGEGQLLSCDGRAQPGSKWQEQPPGGCQGMRTFQGDTRACTGKLTARACMHRRARTHPPASARAVRGSARTARSAGRAAPAGTAPRAPTPAARRRTETARRCGEEQGCTRGRKCVRARASACVRDRVRQWRAVRSGALKGLPPPHLRLHLRRGRLWRSRTKLALQAFLPGAPPPPHAPPSAPPQRRACGTPWTAGGRSAHPQPRAPAGGAPRPRSAAR
jgi:hypothetical protein